MYLAVMIAVGEDDLVCDLAETYQVHEMHDYSVEHIATLAYGLRDDSLIKQRLSGTKIDIKTTLLARIADNTALNLWMKTKDGQKGVNRPKSVLEIISGKDKQHELKGFNSGSEFMEEWRRING